MTSKQRVSLEQYARRRYVLSGTAVVREHYPYLEAMERLGVVSPGARDAKMVSFAHYDYLALSSDDRIKLAAKCAIDNIGVGASASRLVGGERAAHRDLEAEFAQFIGVDDTLALVSGYGTNVTLVGHLLTKGDIIIVDETSHNSIMSGTQLSRAETLTFRHNDLEHLAALLHTHRARYGRVMVVIEGLYSMDGDLPDLPAIVRLCRDHGAWLMVDEAHSIGVLGKAGRGITEYFGVPASEVDLIVGTLSKAFGACGGLIGGRAGVIEWLRCTLPGFVYSVGMPPPIAYAARSALHILQAEPERLVRLHDNSRYFLRGARGRGLNVGTAVGAAIVPIMFSQTAVTIQAGNAALRAGYFVPPIVQIAVPKELPRLRFFITAGHSHEQIDGVLDALAPFVSEFPAGLVNGDDEVRLEVSKR